MILGKNMMSSYWWRTGSFEEMGGKVGHNTMSCWGFEQIPNPAMNADYQGQMDDE